MNRNIQNSETNIENLGKKKKKTFQNDSRSINQKKKFEYF